MVNNTVYHLVGSNLEGEIFLKKREHQKRVFWNRIETFYCFLVIKRILKGLFSVIPWLLNSSDFSNYGLNSRKRYTLGYTLKQWKVEKVEIPWASFVQKNTFLQLKHIQRIYLTSLLTTCVKIHQIPYVNFEIIVHFSRHNSSVFFELKHHILLTKVAHQSANFRLSNARVTIHQIPYVIF